MSREDTQEPVSPPMLILDDERDIKSAVNDHDVRLTTVELSQARYDSLLEQQSGAFDAILNGQDAIREDTKVNIKKLEKTIARATAPMNALVAYVIADNLAASPNGVIATTVITLVLSLAFPELSAAASQRARELLSKFLKTKGIPVEVSADSDSVPPPGGNGRVPPPANPNPLAKRQREKSRH